MVEIAYDRKWRAEHPYGIYPETFMSPHERRQFQVARLSANPKLLARFPNADVSNCAGLNTHSSDPVERKAANLVRLLSITQ